MKLAVLEDEKKVSLFSIFCPCSRQSFLFREIYDWIIISLYKLNRHGVRRKPLQHRRLNLAAVGVLHLALGLL